MTDTGLHDQTTPVAPPRRRRGAGFLAGVGLVLAGLAVLGYVAWQLFGTNLLSRHAHQELVRDLQQRWAAHAEQQTAEAPNQVNPGNASALIRIPAFGDDYVVPVLEGVRDSALASGFGHFPRTAHAGQKGNYALAGHRVTHGEPLRDMPKLRPGDEIIVETRDAIHTYVLDTDPNDLVVDFRSNWVLDPVPTNPSGGVQPRQERGQRLITLTTCSELFHTDERMIAFGHLVSTERK